MTIDYKLNCVLQAKKIYIFISVRCCDHFVHSHRCTFVVDKIHFLSGERESKQHRAICPTSRADQTVLENNQVDVDDKGLAVPVVAVYVKRKACRQHRGIGDQIRSRREQGGKGVIEAQIEDRNADRAVGDRKTELFTFSQGEMRIYKD